MATVRCCWSFQVHECTLSITSSIADEESIGGLVTPVVDCDDDDDDDSSFVGCWPEPVLLRFLGGLLALALLLAPVLVGVLVVVLAVVLVLVGVVVEVMVVLGAVIVGVVVM